MRNKNSFCISPMYIILTMFVALFGALGFAFLPFAFDDLDFHIFIVIFPVVFLFEFLNFYTRAPFIYKCATLTEKGIKYGKNFIKYADIKNIKIYCGYVRERYSLIKDFFRKPLAEIYVGDIICINCDFTGFGFKGSKERLYVPKNKQTDAVLRQYVNNYASVSDGFCDKPDKTRFTWTTFLSLISCCIVAFICVMLFAVAKGNLYVIFSLILMSLSFYLFLLRNIIMVFVYNLLH